MIGTRKWIDLLDQQYSFVAKSEDGRHLLLTMRESVKFLETDPQARGYVQEMNRKGELSYRRWFASCEAMRNELSNLESDIRALGARLNNSLQDLTDFPNPNVFENSKHILVKIEESEWYQSWAHLTDDLSMETLHLERLPQTQTGHMISHVLSITRALVKLAGAVDIEQTTAVEFQSQAERLWQQYGSARRRAKNEWISSGKHALDQLKVAVEIMDGEVFVDPDNLKFPKVRRFTSWLPLMVMYAPPELKDDAKYRLNKLDAAPKNFEEELVPLLRWHLDRVFTEMQFLASSRLAHQSVVERYKVRCENYDWKQIKKMIETYAEGETVRSEAAKKKPRYEFEDLLTLHFARYMHDNGYAVHYTPRDGVHEPDLLGYLSSELEPIVIEAKVVGQLYGTEQGERWILDGLRAILAYLQKYQSDHGVTNGYLVVFRIGDETFPMYTFDPIEWVIGGFTIIPRVINLGRINKQGTPVIIELDSFLESYQGSESIE